MAEDTPKAAEISEELRKRIFVEERLKKLSQPIFDYKSVGTLALPLLLILGSWLVAKWDAIKERPTIVIYAVLGGLIYGALMLGSLALVRAFARWKLLQEARTIQLTYRTEELQKKLDENFFTNLVKINFKYIDKYYLQTQVQTNKSFVLSSVAATVSFAIVVAGIILLYVDKSQATGRICCNRSRNARSVHRCRFLLRLQPNNYQDGRVSPKARLDPKYRSRPKDQ